MHRATEEDKSVALIARNTSGTAAAAVVVVVEEAERDGVYKRLPRPWLSDDREFSSHIVLM